MNLAEYIKKHYQFAFLLIIWCISGIYASPSYLGIIPLSVILLKRKKMYVELICGLFFIVILSDSWSFEMTWAANVKDIYMVMLALLLFFDHKEFPYKNTIFHPFIPYFVIALLVIPRSPDMFLTIQKTVSYILVFIVLPAYYTKLLNEEPQRFLKGLIYTATCLLLYGFLLIFINYDTAYLGGRYRGVMGNPNGLGLLCTVFFAFFTIVNSKFKDLFSRNETGLIYGIILLSVFLTGSRNTLLSIIIFFVFSRFFKVSYWLGFMLIISIAVVYQVVLTNLTEILTALGLKEYMRADNIEEGSGRIVAWKFAWIKIQENFFFGRGIGYESWIFQQFAKFLSKLGHMGNSHNSYLATWLNTGIIGLIFFLYAFIYRFIKASVKSPYALPLMYCVLFSAFFEAWLIGSLNPHTPLLLLMWALMMLDVKEESIDKKIAISKYKIPWLNA